MDLYKILLCRKTADKDIGVHVIRIFVYMSIMDDGENESGTGPCTWRHMTTGTGLFIDNYQLDLAGISDCL